jgi:hypothetical protein
MNAIELTDRIREGFGCGLEISGIIVKTTCPEKRAVIRRLQNELGENYRVTPYISDIYVIKQTGGTSD